MVKKKGLFVLFAVFLLFVTLGFVSAYEFNGTVHDIYGNILNNSNVSVLIRDNSWSQVWQNHTTTNASGWFNMTLPENTTYLYQITIIRYNAAVGYVDYVGKALPAFPYKEISLLPSVNFYLEEAGTINITAINSTADRIPFAYQIKDTQLGYPIASASDNSQTSVIAYVPKNRNYSIMIYPRQGGNEHFVPVSFDWSNFSSASDYSFGLSSYNSTKKTLHKQFNVTESFARITGYIQNSSGGDFADWVNFTVVPFLFEPGNMIYMGAGPLPYNASSWNLGQTDEYNGTSGWFNITVPYAASETVNYLFFAAAQNSTFYGAYRNITVTGSTQINFTMRELLGSNSFINMSNGGGGANFLVYTKKQTFNLLNSTNSSLSQVSAHIEVIVDYTDYGAGEFTFMEDVAQSGSSASFSLPLLNVTGVKEINVYSSNYAPKRVPTKTALQIATNPNITLPTFNPQALDGTTGSSISIDLYRSNATCDVPNPPSGCSLTDSSNMATFNPLSAVIGGGAISFRMGMGSVLVHYVNVDMLASGPPDALFEDNNDITEGTSGSFSKAMRFGSQGPTIYDYVLISIPYTPGSTSQTGLDESKDINMSIPTFYDESWNTVWSTTNNGTSAAALAGNISHYSKYQSDWAILMSAKNCTRTVSQFNATNPCYVDVDNNNIWIRLPHFSGTGPNVAGGVITATSTDGDGPSGGGGDDTTQSERSHSWTKITPGAAAIWKLNDKELGIKEISIEVNNPAQNVKITIIKYTRKPAGVAKEKSGKVFQYLKFNTENLENNLSKATLTLQVNKTWLSDNNLDKDNMALFKFDNNTENWNELTTTYKEDDSENNYYETEVVSFSYFAIAEKVAAAATPGTTSTCIPDWGCTEWSDCVDDVRTRICTDSNNCGVADGKPDESKRCGIIPGVSGIGVAGWILIIIVILATIGVVAFIVYTWYKKKKSSGK